MVGDERTGIGSPRFRLQHGRFNFNEAAFFQIATNASGDQGTSPEGFSHIGIDDQIDIPLTVAFGHVREAMPFVRQGQQRFGQQGVVGDVHR